MSDLTLSRPHSEEQRTEIHRRLYEYIALELTLAWPSFEDGCECIAIIVDEIVDNRFLHNQNTRNVRIRLKCSATGAGELKIFQDGVPFDDMKAVQSSEVVEAFVARLETEHHGVYTMSENVILTDSPKVCQTINFQFRTILPKVTQ